MRATGSTRDYGDHDNSSLEFKRLQTTFKSRDFTLVPVSSKVPNSLGINKSTTSERDGRA